MSSKAKKQKMDRLVLMMIPIGVAVNFIGGQIAILLRLPMYLDSIGTIVVAALCGWWPGLLVGVIANVLNSISSPIYIWYASLSALFAIVAAFFSRKKFFLSFPKTLFTALVFALIGGGIGACLTWTIFGFDFGTTTSVIFAIPLHNAGLPKFLAQFIAEFGMDLFDKVITVIAVYAVLKAMPVRFLTKLPFGDIYIKDSDKQDEDAD